MAEPSRSEIDDFIRANDVDDRAAADLRDCPPDVQRKVLARGELSSARNPSAALLARIRDARVSGSSGLSGSGGGPRGSQEVEDFIGANDVDESAADSLRSSSPTVQRTVLSRGELKTARNPSSALLARIRDAKLGIGVGMGPISGMPGMGLPPSGPPPLGAYGGGGFSAAGGSYPGAYGCPAPGAYGGAYGGPPGAPGGYGASYPAYPGAGMYPGYPPGSYGGAPGGPSMGPGGYGGGYAMASYGSHYGMAASGPAEQPPGHSSKPRARSRGRSSSRSSSSSSSRSRSRHRRHGRTRRR
mmetsp:Transcript_84703/g.263513  ORF Transcript_84703/g.263513 Transcript_84703/m.263513 type:complete len:300 (-) Transcript_84703:265-1164(-)